MKKQDVTFEMSRMPNGSIEFTGTFEDLRHSRIIPEYDIPNASINYRKFMWKVQDEIVETLEKINNKKQR